MIGRKIRTAVQNVLAPNTRAASSKVEFMLRKTGVSSITLRARELPTRCTQTMTQNE